MEPWLHDLVTMAAAVMIGYAVKKFESVEKKIDDHITAHAEGKFNHAP